MQQKKKISSESTKKQKDSPSKERKFIIPEKTTNFLKNTLVEYKRVGKTNSYKITHQAQLIPYNDHTGLNLKEIIVQPRDSWQEGDKRLEKRMKQYIDTSIVESEKRMKQYIDTSIAESEKRMKKHIDNSIGEIKSLIISMNENINKRFDKLESLPTIKKELKQIK